MISSARTPTLPALPLVGRASEMATLLRTLEAARQGKGSTLFLAGEGGVGKTRLATALADDAARRGDAVAVGRAYPVERGVPYALFSDALLPMLRAIDAATLAVLSRGGEAELHHLFPALGSHDAARVLRGDPAEFKSRLLWNFSQFLGRMASRRPLLIVLENLQWADASSLELLHFTARQIAGQRILLLCSYNEAEKDEQPALAATERSLVSLGAAAVVRLAPLGRADLDELLRKTFGAESDGAGEFASMLFDRTQGNPFFVEEMLKALLESGRLREREGRWTGWSTDAVELPRTVRDALVARLDRLSEYARRVADLAAVVGTRVRYDVLHDLSGLAATDLVAAVDELRRARVLVESPEGTEVVYDFTHPMLQDTLYRELGRARARLLHAAIAEALERRYAADTAAHAGELAFHFARADAREAAPKAARYLAAAGRAALAKYATREAVSYLGAALELHDLGLAPASEDGADLERLVEDLARARQRGGEYDAARTLWTRARAHAEGRADWGRLGSIERRMGLASYWSGRHEEALTHYEHGLAAAERVTDDALAARLRIAKGTCLLELGRAASGLEELEAARAIAERTRDPGLLARTYRALMMSQVMLGEVERARSFSSAVITHAAAAGQLGVEWSAHHAMAVLAGLTGNANELTRHVEDARRVASALRSPVLDAWTAEVSIEYASGVGDWEAGLALAERTIPVARALGQRTLLPRLLVWTGLMHLGRDDLDTARACFNEAWTLSGAAAATEAAPVDVHTVVPAHTGMAAWHLARREYGRAIALGERGVAYAERSGYVVWTIHRLMPIIIEASLWRQDFERAERYGARLRRESERMGHRLGLAWAKASDALVMRLKHKSADAIAHLREAADELDAIPFVLDAARVRRNVAQLLAADGDREGAMRELRRAHDVFARVGAEGELRATRDQLRELGARPPARTLVEGGGAGALTGREREIATLVARRKSNKEIGVALGISSRTVSTHLSNVFTKLGVTSRGELTDWVREHLA